MQDPELFDREIRSMLSEAEEPVPAGAWEAVSAALDKKARKAGLVVLWRRAAVGLAAAAALVAGIFLAWPDMDHANITTDSLLATNFSGNEPGAGGVVAKGLATPGQGEGEGPDGYELSAGESPLSEDDDEGDVGRGRANEVSESFCNHSAGSSLPEKETVPTETPVAAVTAEAVAEPEQPAAADETFDIFHPENDLFEVVPQKQRRRLAFSAGGNLESNASPSRSRFTGHRAPGIPRTGVSEHGDNSSYGIPLTLGLGLQWHFSPHWALGTGIGYSYLSRSFTGTYTEATNGIVSRQVTADIDNGIHYIGVPLNLYYQIGDHRPVQFYTFAGATLEKGIKNCYRIKDAGGDIIYRQNVDGVQLSFALGLGVSFRLTDHIGIYLDPSLRYYLENSQPKSIRTAQPLMMSLEAGIRFGL